MGKRTQLIIVLVTFLIYCGIIFASNVFAEMTAKSGNETYEMISGILFGFVGIPIFALIIPLWLARKWDLEYSFWPRNKNPIIVIVILLIYVILANYEPLKIVLTSGISFPDFLIHYFSSMLFHITYYPLFVVFMFPVLRKNFGLTNGIVLTALSFASYHLIQYHYFPAGLTPKFQILLFISFCANILFYLWSESILLVGLSHTFNGALGLISGGTVFNQIDFFFYLAMLIIGGFFVYMVIYEIRSRKTRQLKREWWLNVSIKKRV